MLSRKFGIVGLLKYCGWFLAPFEGRLLAPFEGRLLAPFLNKKGGGIHFKGRFGFGLGKQIKRGGGEEGKLT